MGGVQPTIPKAVGYHSDAPTVVLVFEALRCWMAGYETRDVACWDLAWDALCREMPIDRAKPLFGELQHFARTLRDIVKEPLGWRPRACRGLCKDEGLVLALLDAAQRFDDNQLDLAARHLVNASDVGRARNIALAFSQALARAGLFVAPVSPPALDAVLTGRRQRTARPPQG